MSAIMGHSMKIMMKVGGAPILFASSCASELHRIPYRSRFLRKMYTYKTKSASSYGIRLLNNCSTRKIRELAYNDLKKRSKVNLQDCSNCYHITRCYSGHNHETTTTEQVGNSEQKQRNINSLIETWFYEVCSRGSLEADLPFRTEIRSLRPEDYPDMNRVIIEIHYDGDVSDESPSAHQLSQISDLYDLKVGFDDDKANMRISCDVIKGVLLPVSCTLVVPLQFDLNVKVHGDSSISVHKMESNAIVIENEKGNCSLNHIKCGSLSALCQSGSITSKSALIGNVYFHTGKSGNIVTEKLQGSNIICETEMGSVVVKTLYADSAIFKSDAGDVHLGQCHGQVYLQAERSHLKIESLDGDLDAGLQAGSVEVHLSRHSKADIEVTTGDISISFPEDASTDLNLDCQEIILDKRINPVFTDSGLPHHKEGYIGEKGKAILNARTLSGRVYLKVQDWIQTMKLGLKPNNER